jgi:hypothetical protein
LERKWEEAPALIKALLHNAVDHYWGETPRSGSVIASVLAAGDAAGVELRADLTFFGFLAAQVDHFIRARKSIEVLRALLPLPVRVYAHNFPALATEGGRAEILPPIDYASLLDATHRALAVVNINPNIDDDAHDRVYAAFGCGALPISDVNPWWRATAPALLPYSYDFRSTSAAEAVTRVLDDPARAAALAEAEGARFRAANTFTAQVARALDVAAATRFVNALQPVYNERPKV